jgi:hypothetical protein
MKVRVLAIAGVLFALSAAVPLRAETVLAPFIGETFGGGAKDDFGDDTHPVYGGTLSFLGQGPFGFEIDGQYSPKFFGGMEDSNVSSLMGELTLGGGDRRLRFYLTGGAGLLKTRLHTRDQFFTVDRNSFGLTGGASAILGLGDTLGIKGDLRYFHGLTDVTVEHPTEIDLSGFHFWRGSAGLAFRF